MKAYSTRYRKVGKGGKICCPDGTAHLIDENVECYVAGVYEHFIKA
jgi:hypothetical protein